MLCGPFTSSELTSCFGGLSFTANVVGNAKQAEGKTVPGLERYYLRSVLHHLSMKHYRLAPERMMYNYCGCAREVMGSL